MIPRLITNRLQTSLKEQKVVLISGPRRSGKQTLLRTVLDQLSEKQRWFDLSVKGERNKFSDLSESGLTERFGEAEFIVIEEAQYLDNLQELIEYVLSGVLSSTLVISCSFRPKMDEVLMEVLRLQQLEFRLYPPCFYELAQNSSLPEMEKNLEERLIFGSFPEVIESSDTKSDLLIGMIQDVVFTDLGVNDRINKGERLIKMLQQLAFRISEPVSYNEIGEKCDLDNETVERYVDLLEEAGVLFRLPSFHNELRYELKKTHLIYFMDNGIRNALIRNFNPPDFRNDMDALWKNWVIAERIKWNRMNGREAMYQFWRTHTRQTMDLLEFSGEHKHAYRISWEKKKKIKYPRQFSESYPYIALHTLNRSTYWSFLTKK